MRIATLGGGPGGLYASLLLKKANPARAVEVFEQNSPDATYGWGVVFSDRTLASFREADHPTYEGITDRFVLWDAIDIRYRDTLIRAGGQPFAGISRKQLLGLLQDRGRELGVEFHFETRIEHLEEVADRDLVIAADGLHSVVREPNERSFRTTLSQGRARYIWFGTDLPLDSFTFIFRQSSHGLFQVHAYPFDGTTSTFIVECAEDVWRAAGLDEATTEESIAFCQELFAQDLRGHRLLSNNSQWISFVTVKNGAWRLGNGVLLGDAAHTAHFSIGSGTKLAMEDAIALANAFERHGDDLDAALGDYELDRRPRVERLQDAARRSQEYFENIKRYAHMDPEQFAFHLLTRSGRIDYTNLRLRDPHLVQRVDGWFAARADGRPAVAPPPLFHPLPLRDVVVPNRVAAAVGPTDASRDGMPDEMLLGALGRAARSGAGLVLTGVVAVSADGRITPGDPGLYEDEQADAWATALSEARSVGEPVAGIVLGHAGRRGSTRPRLEGVDRPLAEGAWPLLGPSPLPYAAGGRAPKEMDRADLDGVREAFVRAAGAALRSGFDLLVVHMARGYLLASFLSPLANRRQDEYGGPIENRLRYPLEVFDAVRAAWPEDRPLAAAVTVDDQARGGLTADDGVEITAALRAHGCDLLLPLAGQTTPGSRPAYGPAYLADRADRVRNEVGIPTLLAGAITTADQVNTLVAGGRADLCVLDPPA